MQQRNELIAHLKDRLQELKAKTQMEAKYVKKSTDNSVAQVKKKCDLSEVELRQHIEVRWDNRKRWGWVKSTMFVPLHS